eukprot:TRINITY_DN21546_c0_g1_i1.p1 TRINITY_DN21546_c0_g1~~TRINITY_DN21546_c0_g1_i1.p1  ORF type:complete len:156 (-),score=24.00 TRINITY_DN21546_c0_g1_i1:23-490(-)
MQKVEEIDELCKRYFRLYDKYIQLQTSLQQSLKSGYWNLARSRHSGVRIIESMIPGSIIPQRVIQPTTRNTTDDATISSVGALTLQDNEDSDSLEVNNVKAKSDPLYWFGYLAPPQLRRCQKEFAQATDIAVDLANIKIQMAEVQARYQELRNSS